MSSLSKINLSANIKKYRIEKGWTQQKLANSADIPLSILTKIEQGISTNPTIQTVIKIADAIGVTVNDLLYD